MRVGGCMLVSKRNAAQKEPREMRTSLSSCRCIEVSVRTKNKNKYSQFPPTTTYFFRSKRPISNLPSYFIIFLANRPPTEKQANAKRTIMRKQSVEVGKSSKCTQEIKK